MTIEVHFSRGRQDDIERLIARIRAMLGIGLCGAEIMEHLSDEDPEMVFLAYHGAKILDEDAAN